MASDAQLLEQVLQAFDPTRAEGYSRAVRELYAAVLIGNGDGLEDARENLGEVIAETMGLTEMLAGFGVLQVAAPEWEGSLTLREEMALARFADAGQQTLVPNVTMQASVDNLADRLPKTIREKARRNFRSIARLYSSGEVIAFVKSAEQEVTEAARDVILSARDLGIPERDVGVWLRKVSVDASPSAQQELRELGERAEGWSERYGRMAFRTNVNTATTSGQFRQVNDPDVQGVIPAFQFNSKADRKRRPNHAAGHGVVLRVDNPQWLRTAPPLEWNCRCNLIPRTKGMLRRLGKLSEDGRVIEDPIPKGWEPHPDFRPGGRVDLVGIAPF